MAEGDEHEASGSPPRRWLEDAGGASPAALRLLRRARPHRVPVGRRQRVWRALEQQSRGRARGRRFRIVALAALVLVAAAASARAHWARAWVTSAYQALFSRHPVTGQVASPPRVALAPSAAGQVPAAPPTGPEAPPSDEPQVEAAPVSASAPSARHAPAHRPRREDAEMTLLLAAARAIRVDHAPARARALLAELAKKYPQGRFAQEALAMSIEVAVLTHDPAAPGLAARYLERYPTGPFRDTALRVGSAAGGSP